MAVSPSRLLHKVVCLGKRAQAYAIAKRMSAVNSLDLKDSDGMVPNTHLLHQHLTVEVLPTESNTIFATKTKHGKAVEMWSEKQ